jgi:hypothetical protein
LIDNYAELAAIEKLRLWNTREVVKGKEFVGWQWLLMDYRGERIET